MILLLWNGWCLTGLLLLTCFTYSTHLWMCVYVPDLKSRLFLYVHHVHLLTMELLHCIGLQLLVLHAPSVGACIFLVGPIGSLK